LKPGSRILVTGGTGFTGSYLVGDLIKEGHAVRAIARSGGRARSTLSPKVEIIIGDITDPRAVEHAVKDREVVFHLATTFREAGLSEDRVRAVHVTGTRLLLEASQQAGVSRFVHCSTVGVHSHIETPPADETWPHTPADIYQQTKSEAEKSALEFHRQHGLPLSVARPTPIYGPGDTRLLKLFRMIARRRFVFLGNGKIFYHMVYVSDLVSGFKLLATRPEAVGEAFILGGGQVCTLEELTRLIADAVGAPPPRVHLPARPFQLAGSLLERLLVPLGIEPPVYRRRVDFFTKSRAFSIDKARRMLGYEPSVDLRTGIRRTAKWYADHGQL
jgi:nucleoside-diphosphate-sugar epimerase